MKSNELLDVEADADLLSTFWPLRILEVQPCVVVSPIPLGLKFKVLQIKNWLNRSVLSWLGNSCLFVPSNHLIALYFIEIVRYRLFLGVERHPWMGTRSPDPL